MNKWEIKQMGSLIRLELKEIKWLAICTNHMPHIPKLTHL